MPKVQVVDASGKKVAQRELAPEVFEAKVSVPLMHQVVVAGMAAIRRGTHATKTRGDVSGGGRKPWRQKGTGRARQGSIRAPQWTGGGVAHGPHPRDHSMRVNKKMKRGALRSALTDALSSGKVSVVDELRFDEPKTRRAAEVIQALELQGSVLLVLPGPSSGGIVERSFRNLASVRVAYVPALGVYEVLAADRVLFTQGALDALEGGTQPAQAPPGESPSGEAKGKQGEGAEG
ncbi:MAG TPA: 50S ribosomal protein L4 [Actinomycetota bacterium]|nr:50S ribosomal protein L4 [Actinomycetota bacterium]